MGLRRRTFLQRSGVVLAALGLSEAGLLALTDRYQQALAQPTRRKLALLVGINQYPEQACDCVPVRGTALNGCLTDVELQRELLVYRFGFNPTDIVALTDQKATRDAIEDAFRFHLIEQASPGDVVVFHFSGLGSRVQWTGAGEDETGNTLVPVDGTLSTEDNAAINDIPHETLGLLLRSLNTENVTTVLDASYTNLGRTFQGNLRIRSRPNAPSGRLHETELALQERLMAELKVSKAQIQAQWRSGQLPGTLLSATRQQQVATEGQWNGFSAGLFTYALTQQLWWSTPATTVRTNLTLATGTVRQFAGVEQLPALSGQKVQNQRVSAYYLSPATPDADGVVRAVDEDGKVQLWLAGLPTPVLENYGTSVLSIVHPASDRPPAAEIQLPDTPPASSSPAFSPTEPPTPEASPPEPATTATLSTPLLQIRSRDGLTFRARPCCGDRSIDLHPGQLVQEAVRLLPRNIGLTVALDASLERIERVDATSAFSAVPRVSSVIAGEPADFLFGKTLPNSPVSPTLTASLTPTPVSLKRGYGLFSLGRDAIPNTLVQEEEAVKTAINRITPQLRTLLALKLLRLTANRGSSRLPIHATLEITDPQERIVMQQETVRGQPAKRREAKARVYTADLFTGDGAITIPTGSRIRYRLQNNGEQPVYFILLGLDTRGNPIAFFPALENNLIPPGETVIVPQAISEWVIQDPPGLVETHLVFSRSPLTQSYAALKSSSKESRQIGVVHNPLDLAQTILQDLHAASADILPKIDLPTDTYALDVNAWATLGFLYQVSET
ncbi:caspase family protein [Egbenema bharatensis]|uniref:caspase family protein n=1 Tax=Egbenema bharatensis TaxID=3463334 RepID=UPI003A858A3C